MPRSLADELKTPLSYEEFAAMCGRREPCAYHVENARLAMAALTRERYVIIGCGDDGTPERRRVAEAWHALGCPTHV